MLFEFDTSLHFPFGVSRYITGLYWHPSKKLLSFEFDTSFRFQFGASRYITRLCRTSEKNLSLFEFSRSFCFQFRASRDIIGLNRTSKLKVIAVCFGYELPFSILCISIYYGTQSDIRVKSYCRLNLIRASVSNLEHLDILPDSIRHPS